MTPDGKQQHPGLIISAKPTLPPMKNEEDDSFFDQLSRFQSKRMDDQRCSLNVENKENQNITNLPRDGPDDLIDMIAGMQSKRMDEQRVALPHLPGKTQ